MNDGVSMGDLAVDERGGVWEKHGDTWEKSTWYSGWSPDSTQGSVGTTPDGRPLYRQWEAANNPSTAAAPTPKRSIFIKPFVITGLLVIAGSLLLLLWSLFFNGSGTVTADVAEQVRQVVAANALQNPTFKFNPDSALYRRAMELQLGAPKTDEIIFNYNNKKYVAQGFSSGSLYTEYGHWDNTAIQLIR